MVQGNSPSGASEDGGVRARGREFLAALKYLTVGAPTSTRSLEEVARGAAFFPLLGLLLGILVVLVARVAETLTAPAGVALVAVLALVLLTSAALLRGLAGAVTQLVYVPTRNAAGPVPVWLGVVGTGAALLSTFVKWVALVATPSAALGLSLPLAVMLGRWAFVVQAYGSESAEDTGAGAVFPRGMQFREFAFASVFAMATCLVLADAIGLIILLWSAVQTIGLRIVVHRRLGGVSGSTLLAGGELAETATLVFGAALAHLLLSG